MPELPVPLPLPLSLRDPASGRPLRVLITRPDEQAEETAELVRQAGGLPLVHPCLRRAPPRDSAGFLDALSRPDGYRVVAIPSANAALAVAEGLAQLPPDRSTQLRRTPFAAVGPRTAAALTAHGIEPQIVAEHDNTGEGLAAAIAANLRAHGQTLDGAHILVPRAAVANPALVDALGRAGADVIEAVAYEMLPSPPSLLAEMVELLHAGEVDLLPFGSPRTAAVALEALSSLGIEAASRALDRVVIGAIGPTTAAALAKANVRVDVVAQPATFEALLHAMAAFFAPRSSSRPAII